ncbi:hypothetical protein [Mesorhizobium sp. M0227]|uniref:hypothetical protein n=1 Tax=unclassified Mesorhizobium TaxID=325217 RepID=UPI003336CF49
MGQNDRGAERIVTIFGETGFLGGRSRCRWRSVWLAAPPDASAAHIALKILGVKGAQELAGAAVTVGLAQNMAAIPALANLS